MPSLAPPSLFWVKANIHFERAARLFRHTSFSKETQSHITASSGQRTKLNMSKSDHGHEAFENTISNDQPNSDEDQTPPPTRKLGHLRRLKALKVQSPSDSEEIEGPPRKRARLRRGKPSSGGSSSDENVAQLANEVDEDRMLILSLDNIVHNFRMLHDRDLGVEVKNPSQDCVSEKFSKTQKLYS